MGSHVDYLVHVNTGDDEEDLAITKFGHIIIKVKILREAHLHFLSKPPPTTVSFSTASLCVGQIIKIIIFVVDKKSQKKVNPRSAGTTSQ